MWQKIFGWSKKIHIILMWAVVVLGGWMMFSGFVMHRELEQEWIPQFIDTLFIRTWHNSLSQWFLIVLVGQMLTGFGMWLAPRILRKAQSNRQMV